MVLGCVSILTKSIAVTERLFSFICSIVLIDLILGKLIWTRGANVGCQTRAKNPIQQISAKKLLANERYKIFYDLVLT